MGEKRPKLLIVDDERANLNMLGAMLEKEYEISVSTKGEEVEGLAAAEGFDLILLDIIMPGMSGLEVCGKLKGNPATREIPVIFITARTDPEVIAECFAAGAVDYIPKPLKRPEVTARVRAHIQLALDRERLAHELSERKRAEERLRQRNEMIQEDLDLAGEFQRSVLPRKIDVPFVTAAHRYIPLGEVSGDIYDWSRSADGSLLFFLGDATGHGITAALLTMMFHIGMDGMDGNLPTNVLCTTLNRLFAVRDKKGKFITGIFLRISPEGHLSVTNAGHPPMIVISPDDPNPLVFKSTGAPIGLFMDGQIPYAERHHDLNAGDRIFLVTDGLTEWRNTAGEQYGMNRMVEFVSEHRNDELEKVIDGLMEHVRCFSANEACTDDLTIFGFQFQAMGGQ